MNIGQAAKATGISARMIRHYEAQGLLPPPTRTAAGYRVYGHAELQVLGFIRNARAFGFCLEQIGQLIELTRRGADASGDIIGLLNDRLCELKTEEDALRARRELIERALERSTTTHRPGCAFAEILSTRDQDLSAA